MKRQIAILLVAALTASVLAGCSGESSNSSSGTSQTDTTDMVYEASSPDFGDDSFDAGNVISLGTGSGNFYAVCEDSSPVIYIFTDKGEVRDTITVPSESTQNITSVAATDDGFVLVLSSYTMDYSVEDADTADTETALSGTYTLLYLSEDGTEKWRTELDKSTDGSSIEGIDSIFCEDGNIYLATTSELVLINKDDGSVQSQVYAVTDSEYYNQYYPLEDGSIAVLQYTDDGQVFGILDADTGKLSDDTVAIPSGLYMQSAFAGMGNTLYVAGENGIYKADMKEKTFTQILDFIASDLNATGVSALAGLSDDVLAAVLSDNDGNSELDILTKADTSDQKDKTAITVGGYSLDYTVRKAIVAFNKENDNYKIEIKDYTSYDSDEGTEGMDQLNTDIISGNAPDIMILDNDMPVSSYIEKGVLLPLDDYLDSDSDIDSDNYLTNISDAFRTDGKLYEIVPAFSLETVAGKTSDIGDGSDFNLEMLRNLQKERNAETGYLFGLYDRSTLLDSALSFVGNMYVDLENGKSTFDSDSFRDLLAFIKECPDSISDEQYSEDSSTFYRSGKSLFYISDLTSFSDYQSITQGMFGDAVTFAGFPAEKNSGIVIRPQMQLAVSASTKEKEACWEFLKYFLMDDFQSSVDQNFSCWPVSVTAIDALGEEAKKNPTYTDENGNEVEQPNEYYLGTESIELKPLTDEEVENVKNILKSASETFYYNSDVQNIISEETGAYFEGQKDVEEVTDVIQNRVNTYIKENS